jgi:hypothetical protein
MQAAATTPLAIYFSCIHQTDLPSNHCTIMSLYNEQELADHKGHSEI